MIAGSKKSHNLVAAWPNLSNFWKKRFTQMCTDSGQDAHCGGFCVHFGGIQPKGWNHLWQK